MSDIATAPRAGTAQIQGDLWSARARDYAEIMEGFSARYTRARSGGPNLLRLVRASMLDGVPV